MAEYIDKEDVVMAVSATNPHFSDRLLIIGKIREIPAADVRPVVHGTWVYDDETGEIYCSKCGRTTNDRHDEIQEFEGKKVLALCYPRYCGFCGADMREEADDA